MIGDYSSVRDHLTAARTHADQAETNNNPAQYREAIDEMVAAIEILMRNTSEQEK